MRQGLLIFASIALLLSGRSFAAEGTVTFNGTVLPSCLITIGTPGTLAADASYSQISSKNVGGIAGTASVVATAPTFSLSTTAPVAFTSAPAGGGDDVTFASTYSTNGVTSVTDVAGGVATQLGLGLTNVDVDLTATKASGAFPAGNYVADVTITCE
ncbi:hypothetical protein [Nitratireductor basaltis]|uniref:Spore coat protein U domain-containing protein n=1 Tax=Nitratireductor basaltis TaxID=472175 RepID=A0A084UA04_9HYPH|nr:hypothetical protein [Nitratireductor basaltis]KFB09790.1 hypothetical protein EL18_00809 [Nitratireductor basaltis]